MDELLIIVSMIIGGIITWRVIPIAGGLIIYIFGEIVKLFYKIKNKLK